MDLNPQCRGHFKSSTSHCGPSSRGLAFHYWTGEFVQPGYRPMLVIGLANDWINDNDCERPEKAPRSLGAAGTVDKPRGTRSIFDDVDV